MKYVFKYTILIILSIFSCFESYGQTYYSLAEGGDCDGSWDDGDCWSTISTNGASCGCEPVDDANYDNGITIIIDNDMTFSQDIVLEGGTSLTITNNKKL